jgi:hypothetical protein
MRGGASAGAVPLNWAGGSFLFGESSTAFSVAPDVNNKRDPTALMFPASDFNEIIGDQVRLSRENTATACP